MTNKWLEKRWVVTIPNLIASIMLTCDHAFLANCIFVPGGLLMIWYNYQIKDKAQQRYFMVLELLAIIGVVWYLYKKWIMV